MTRDRVYCWYLILEEYGPKIIIKGEDNIVTDAMSRLEYNPEINVKKLYTSHRCKILVKLFQACAETQRRGVCNKYVNSHIKTVFLISDDLKATDVVNNMSLLILVRKKMLSTPLLLLKLRQLSVKIVSTKSTLGPLRILREIKG